MSDIRWACPKCGTDSNGGHGKGGPLKCVGNSTLTASCGGFICDCPEETPEGHGDSLANPCSNAVCYHCGWAGEFPRKIHLKKNDLIPCPHCNGTGITKKGSNTHD